MEPAVTGLLTLDRFDCRGYSGAERCVEASSTSHHHFEAGVAASLPDYESACLKR